MGLVVVFLVNSNSACISSNSSGSNDGGSCGNINLNSMYTSRKLYKEWTK